MINQDSLAPISLFVYNRFNETQKTVEALCSNFLASESELYVFSDGPKNESDIEKVNAIRDYLLSVQGFKSVEIIESPINKGLANSIIEGVTMMLKKYNKVIVLEDDLISSPDFLNFMNESLAYYCDNTRIFNVSGFSLNLPSLETYSKDYYLGYRASSWGWGTWKNRWDCIDWKVTDFNHLKWNPIKFIQFMRGGSDMPLMLWKQMNGKIDSWAIRWCYHQFKNDLLTVFPSKTKIKSIGIGADATHTKKTKRFCVNMERSTQVEYNFEQNLFIDKQLKKEFRKKYSIISRINDRF